MYSKKINNFNQARLKNSGGVTDGTLYISDMDWSAPEAVSRNGGHPFTF